MNKRKLKISLLTVSIIMFGISYSDFVTIVDGNEIAYTSDSFSDRVEYTNWAFDREDNCINDINESEIYYGRNFQQVETCDEVESRTKTVIRTYDSGTEEVLSETTEERSNSLIKSPVTKTGTHLESSCKLILDNGFSLGDGNYPISKLGSVVNYDCDMTTDNGGWTKLVTNTSHTVNGSAPTVNLDTSGIPHTEMLYVDNGTWKDYTGTSSGTDWRMEGFNNDNNVLLINGEWYSKKEYYVACELTPKELPDENYRTLERNGIDHCHMGIGTNMASCSSKIVVKLPDGGQLQGISDVESAYNSCQTDNEVYRNFTLYIR